MQLSGFCVSFWLGVDLSASDSAPQAVCHGMSGRSRRNEFIDLERNILLKNYTAADTST